MRIIHADKNEFVAVHNGETILDVLQREGIALDAPCGGKGTCGKCLVAVEKDTGEHDGAGADRPTKPRVLACQTCVSSHMTVTIESTKSFVIANEGARLLRPGIEGSLTGQSSAARPSTTESSTAQPSIARPSTTESSTGQPSIARTSTTGSSTAQPSIARSSTTGSSTTYSKKTAPLPPLGIAVDLGTTTLVARLVDLQTGATLKSIAQMNPQKLYGADVISRISAAEEGKLEQMTRLIREALTSMVCALSSATPLPIAVAGNTVMQHILAGLSPVSIGVAPFTPQSLFGTTLQLEGLSRGNASSTNGTNDAGNPDTTSTANSSTSNTASSSANNTNSTEVWLAPCVSGYVGGDITCGLLALDMQLKPNAIVGTSAKSAETQLLIDLGTNGELALSTAKGIYCCATAAGPVFEGANITCGMPALPGAISAVHLAGQHDKTATLQIETIANATPTGICGTGLVDAIALMLDLGIIDTTGMMCSPGAPGANTSGTEAPTKANHAPDTTSTTDTPTAPNAPASPFDPHDFLAEKNGSPVFYLSQEHDIYVTQTDVRNYQLAKSAIFSGILTLADTATTPLEQIDQVCIAGGLGNAIKESSAIRSGLIPKEFVQKTTGVGNTAIEGAALALTSAAARKQAQIIADQCHYIELSTSPTFNQLFMDNMYF